MVGVGGGVEPAFHYLPQCVDILGGAGDGYDTVVTQIAYAAEPTFVCVSPLVSLLSVVP